jgi:hypothetical protein
MDRSLLCVMDKASRPQKARDPSILSKLCALPHNILYITFIADDCSNGPGTYVSLPNGGEQTEALYLAFLVILLSERMGALRPRLSPVRIVSGFARS